LSDHVARGSGLRGDQDKSEREWKRLHERSP
jgi:hypothetical protein